MKVVIFRRFLFDFVVLTKQSVSETCFLKKHTFSERFLVLSQGMKREAVSAKSDPKGLHWTDSAAVGLQSFWREAFETQLFMRFNGDSEPEANSLLGMLLALRRRGLWGGKGMTERGKMVSVVRFCEMCLTPQTICAQV